MRYQITCKKLYSQFLRCIHRMQFSTLADKDALLTEVGTCGIITLNRPKVLNSLDLSMIRKIYPCLKKWDQSKTLSHVLIEGTGEKSFCAGGDVRMVVTAAKNGGSAAQDFFREEYRLNHLIGTLRMPYIALIDGITMGGGVGLSVHGNYRVATDRTMFAMPETAIGLFPDVGGGYFLPRLKKPGLGLYLALTGHRLKGAEVFWAGVATHFVPSSKVTELRSALTGLKLSPAASASEAEEAVSRLLNQFHDASAAKSEPSISPRLGEIGSVFTLRSGSSPTHVEEIIDRLKQLSEQTSDAGTWARKTYDLITAMSPTSLKVTLRQLQEGAQLSFADNFRMEYRLSQRFVAGHDFPEGVRAVLVDRDNKPVWKPSTLAEVSDNDVQAYFEPLAHVKEWSPE